MSKHGKLLFLLAMIIILPLLLAGILISKAVHGKLGGADQPQLSLIADNLAKEFNDFFEYSLFIPLDLVGNAIGGPILRSDGKISILEQGIESLPDVVLLQVTIAGVSRPISIPKKDFIERLKKHFDDPKARITVDTEKAEAAGGFPRMVKSVTKIEEIDTWIATASLPVKKGIGNRKADLYAQINLDRLRNSINAHPSKAIANIHVIKADGEVVFSNGDETRYENADVLATASRMMSSWANAPSVNTFNRETGPPVVAAVAVPRVLPLAIVVELNEAYAAKSAQELNQYIYVCLAIASAVAMLGSLMVLFANARANTNAHAINISPHTEVEAKPTATATTTTAAPATLVPTPNIKPPQLAPSQTLAPDRISEPAAKPKPAPAQMFDNLPRPAPAAKPLLDRQSIMDNHEKSSTDMKLPPVSQYHRLAVLHLTSKGDALNLQRSGAFQNVLREIAIKHTGKLHGLDDQNARFVFEGHDASKNAVECAITLLDIAEDTLVDIGSAGQIRLGADCGFCRQALHEIENGSDLVFLTHTEDLAKRLSQLAKPNQLLATHNIMEKLPVMVADYGSKADGIHWDGIPANLQTFRFQSQTESLLSTLLDD